MPELPEVETIRIQLEKVLAGQKIEKIQIRRDKSFQGRVNQVEGRKIKTVLRRAKVLIIELIGQPKRYLLIHLKMTGQLVYTRKSRDRIVGGHPTKDWIRELPSRHTRVIIKLNKGRLFFNDLRVFGWIKVMSKKQKDEKLKEFGPDVNDNNFTVVNLKEILETSSRAVKVVLMNQHRLAGVGNIYVNEALFCAGINPQEKANILAKGRKKVARLHRCLRKVIAKGIKYGGATASDDSYVNAAGLGGHYQDHFLVYERQEKKCHHCQGKIKKMKIAGRGTYYCPQCQK